MSSNSPMSLNCIREKLDPNNSNCYKSIQAFIDDCRLIFSNACQFYSVSCDPNSVICNVFWRFFYSNFQTESKFYLTAQDLEKFFEIQVRKFLPKYAKSPLSRSNSQQHQFQDVSLQDLIDDEADDEDEYSRNNAKRKRSTPSV